MNDITENIDKCLKYNFNDRPFFEMFYPNIIKHNGILSHIKDGKEYYNVFDKVYCLEPPIPRYNNNDLGTHNFDVLLEKIRLETNKGHTYNLYKDVFYIYMYNGILDFKEYNLIKRVNYKLDYGILSMLECVLRKHTQISKYGFIKEVSTLDENSSFNQRNKKVIEYISIKELYFYKKPYFLSDDRRQTQLNYI